MALVTVSQTVRFALPPGARLLAGENGLARPVTWARVIRTRPTTLASVEQGEVWLMAASALQQAGEPRAVARLLRDVVDAGVVALVVHEPPAEEVLAVAGEIELPVVLVGRETPLADLEKAVVALVVDRDRAIGQRAQEVYDQLLATLMEDRGSELLADIVHDVTGKAVYLLDEHFQANNQTGSTPQVAEALTSVRRRFWEGQLGPVHERLVTTRTSGVGDGLTAVVRPLVLRGAVAGYLALLGERNDFTDFDYQVVERAGTVLAIELAKQAAVVEARLRVQGDFLEELLDSPTPADERLLERASALGYDLGSPHVVFVVRPRSADRAGSPRLFQRFVDTVRRRLVLDNVATLLRERDGAVQVLAPCPPGLPPTGHDQVATWVDGIRLELENALAPDALPLVAGVGRPPDTALTHHAALREAAQAATIAAALPSRTTLHFAQLGALRLIFHLAGNPELESFQQDLLGTLEEYDRQHRSELVQTLDAFFLAGANHMQAARDLHVHRNTLIYRLDRVRDLLGGVNLEDPDTRLNLQLALKIRAAFGARTP